jgi:hypothetical protein
MTTAASNVISSDNVEGTSVYNAAGDKLGSIDDLMIDKLSGQVRYAVLEFGGFLGMNADRYPIPWKVLKYSTDKGGYIVPLDKSQLQNAPKYSDEAETPIYDSSYGGKINSGPLGMLCGQARSRKLAAATSGVMSRCGPASISYPTMNFRTVADRSNGG